MRTDECPYRRLSRIETAIHTSWLILAVCKDPGSPRNVSPYLANRTAQTAPKRTPIHSPLEDTHYLPPGAMYLT
jgi:hypothetical protein